MRNELKHTAGYLLIVVVALCAVLPARADDDSLNPRNKGDWDHTNSPMQTYRQNCHPAELICQLPIRPITKEDSDLNQRALSGERIGTPALPLVPDEEALVGPQIGTGSSLNETSVSGPAIKKRQ